MQDKKKADEKAKKEVLFCFNDTSEGKLHMYF